MRDLLFSTKFWKRRRHCRECSLCVSGLQSSFPVKERDRVTIVQRERQAKSLICLHQNLKQSRGLQCIWNVFQSQIQPTALQPWFFQQQRLQVQQRQCQQFVILPSGLVSHNLQHEEMLVCQPLRGYIHSYCSGLLLWMMKPRCHRKWRRVFCEKLEFFQFLWKESKPGHSCSHRSSRSFSRWKEMVPRVTPYDVDLGPVCLLSRPSSCLQDKRPKQFPTVEHSEVVQKCRSRRRCCCSPGKCSMSWGRALSNKCPVKIITPASGERSTARYAAVSLMISCSRRTRFQLNSTNKIWKFFNGDIIANRVNRLFIITVVCFI